LADEDSWNPGTAVRTWKVNPNVDINKSGTEYVDI